LETAERKYMMWIQGMAAKQNRRKHYGDVGIDRGGYIKTDFKTDSM
jgi:hypothetical protein